MIKSEDGSYAVVGHEAYTQEEYDSWEIVDQVKQVDYSKNLHDEGNGIYSKIYTDASWTSLASALYHAEATAMNPDATDSQINEALTALETAYKSLQRRAFFKPYDYQGHIYYEAICDADNADTYGKWYDSDFKRITSDLTILNLDAYAEPAEIAQIEQNEAVAWNYGKITPTIKILDKVYTELRDEEILGTNWNDFDTEYFTQLMDQRHSTTLSSLISIVEDEELNIDITNARSLVDSKTDVTLAAAREEIQRLNEQITKALEQKQKDEDEKNTNMTPSQRILLTTAVNTAKSVDGYNDPSKIEDAERKQKVEALSTAVGVVENLLANEKATEEQADTALEDINDALEAVGEEAVTEYNTLTHSLPVTSEIYDVVYDVEYPGVTLRLDGKTGKTTINAVVLTKNGVIVKLSKDISIYTPADGVEFTGTNVIKNEDVFSLSLTNGGNGSITAKLSYDPAEHSQSEIDLGNVTIDGETCTVKVGEKTKRWIWASEDMNVAMVSSGSDGSCTITAKGTGTTYITVTIETVEGNTYTARIEVTVS